MLSKKASLTKLFQIFNKEIMLFLLKTFLDFWKLHNMAKKCKNSIAEPGGENLP